MVQRKMLTPIIIGALLLSMPSVAMAQEDFLSFDQPAEIMAPTDRAARGTSPGSSPEDLMKYAKIIRAVELAVSFQTKNNGRGHNIAGMELSSGAKIDAKVSFKKKNGEIYLDELNLTPKGTMKFAGRKINKVTFNRKGELHIDIKGMPDLRITNIEKKRNGDTRLHLKGLPDITIKKDGRVKFLFFGVGDVGADFELPDWPPTLDGLVKMATAPSDSETDVASIVSSVNWKSNATLDASELDMAGEIATFPKGTYNLALSGAAKNVNGRLESMGNNIATVNATFHRNGRLRLGPADADVNSGNVSVTGRYRFSAPLSADSNERVNFEWDGKADFKFNGSNVDLFLPKDTKVYSGSAEAEGSVDHRFVYNGGQPSFEISEGKYNAKFSGPMRLEGVEYEGLKLDPLKLNGTIDMSGDMTTRNGLIVHRGTGSVRTKVDSTGMAAAISGGDIDSKVTILKGSELNADIRRFTTFTPLSSNRSVNYGAGTNFDGRVDLNLLLGATRFKNDMVDLDLPHGPNNLNISTDLNVRHRGDRIDVRRGSFSLSGTTGADGKLFIKNAKTYRRVATVTAERLNVRSGPSIDNARLNSFAKGTKLDILKEAKDSTGKVWYLVEGKAVTGRMVKGYVSSKFTDVSREAVEGLNFDGEIKKGTHLEFNLDSLNQEQDVFKNFAEVIKRAKGGLNAHLVLGNSNLSMGALKASVENGKAVFNASADGGLTGSIDLGNTRVRGDGAEGELRGNTRLDLNGGGRNEDGSRKPVKMEFKINLRAGSKITMTRPGTNTKVTIKGDESHLFFEALATIDSKGNPAVKELKNVDLKLELGEAAANFLGRSVTAPGEKVITLKQGRIVFLDNGIDIYGDFAVHVRSQGDTPALSIRW